MIPQTALSTSLERGFFGKQDVSTSLRGANRISKE